MDCSAVPLPLPNVSSTELAKILEFCRYHHCHRLQQQEQAAYHTQFLSSLTKTKDLFGLILAANYLDIASLTDVLCQRVADTIKVMTSEEIKKYLDIANDFTTEEEAQVRRENQWAFD
ncbi:hypothetical protein L7F22_029946 [Adiantum nelumboides]|nr:hypothetical protein [Adiantum nelumboides]